MPLKINLGKGKRLGIRSSSPFHTGETLCFSGVITAKKVCGPSLEVVKYFPEKRATHPMWDIEVKFPTEEGDSGAPVWDRDTHDLVGIVSGKI